VAVPHIEYLIDRNKALKLFWLEFIDYLINNDLPEHIFLHNLGDFDGYFIFKALANYFPPENVNTIVDDYNSFIQIELNYKGKIFKFKDSLRIFPVPLNELCKVFNVEGKLFNYEPQFQNPQIFNQVDILSKFIDYGIRDSYSLFKALKNAQDLYYKKYRVDITTVFSTSTLSLKILRTCFLKNPIPILNPTIDQFIRHSYYGGGTDVYKCYAENVKYYDVNSLYPHAMLKPMPNEFINYYDNMDNVNLDNFFGFIKAQIECPRDMMRPVLPLKYQGKTIYPVGNWTATYFSEELKAVAKLGYIIKPLTGFEFTQFLPFTDYINHFYESKKVSTGAQRFIDKMHLNQLYGYFGRKLNLIETIIVNNDDLADIVSHYLIKSIIDIEGENKSIVLKHVNLDIELMKQFNKELKLNNKFEADFKPFIKSNVAIASAVTSYARIHMIPFKIDPNTCYTDTDSIFTTSELNPMLVGKGLGLMIDELNGKVISEAYFLGIKEYGYCYNDDNGKQVDRSTWAGVPRNTISFNNIIKLANGGKLNITLTDKFFRSFKDFSINIKTISKTIQVNTDKTLIGNVYYPPKVNLLNYHKNSVKPNSNIILGFIRKILTAINTFLGGPHKPLK
jgi:hypothetical protein